MAFRRSIAPASTLEGKALTCAMAGIGMVFAVEPAEEPNIEDTLLAASVEAMVGDDLRVLSVLVTWLAEHHAWLNADRLVRLVSDHSERRVRAFWSTFAQWQKTDRRFAKLQKWEGDRVALLRVGSDFQLQRRGEDPRFAETVLQIPAGVLRDRTVDILPSRELARRHAAYRCRIVMGPSYRADMWAQLNANPALTPSELARCCYGSFATAWQVKRDFELVRDSKGLPRSVPRLAG